MSSMACYPFINLQRLHQTVKLSILTVSRTVFALKADRGCLPQYQFLIIQLPSEMILRRVAGGPELLAHEVEWLSPRLVLPGLW